METLENPTLQFLGIEFDLTILAMSLLTVLAAFSFLFWASRRMTLKPKGRQNVLEYLYEFVINTIKPNLGAYTQNYSLLLFTFFFFILIANNIGLVTKLEVGDYNLWTSPTANFSVDLTLSLMIACVVHVEGIRKNGIKDYLKGYLAPQPIMLPMNILSELTNIASLALRLFGNIYAGEVVTTLLVQLANWKLFMAPVAFGINLAWTAFSMFISTIQAYVFTMLASSYIGDKVNGSSEE
ncbi:F0F1 ATP synthase subunit A [Streptococcus pantholopis]|uniref:ATP synthase subunit a n=1 Tax=Streptococcus pantholopis TaxID=1811193 RepID=A0A172Q865_9STRE|nr:F0F1 ATP synthase subunit A [Streptococcus pantholopis]AND79617.1 F0F1 ATP synthase subunit A [Streptococcus pantholopis]